MYKQIVVGTDGSAGADVAVDAAIELARLNGATLHVVHAYQVATKSMNAPAGLPPVDLLTPDDAAQFEARRISDQAVERAGRVGVTAEAHCVAAHAVDAILEVAEKSHADLVVAGNRGMSGARRFVVGSVTNRLSHHCQTSLLIVDTAPARAKV